MTSPHEEREDPVYEKTYGSKYAATKGLNRVELAKLIRLDIKAAIKAGELPKGTYGVTCESYAGGGSINVKIKSFEVTSLYNPEHLALEVSDPHYRYPHIERYSPEAKKAIDTLTAIHSAYNYDGSDVQSDYFDVRYYGHVELDWKYEEARQAAETAALNMVSLTDKEICTLAVARAAKNGIVPIEAPKARHLTLVK